MDLFLGEGSAEPSVETFHETVIGRFPRPTVLQANIMFLRPFIQGVACELRPIVRKESAWQASFNRRRSST